MTILLLLLMLFTQAAILGVMLMILRFLLKLNQQSQQQTVPALELEDVEEDTDNLEQRSKDLQALIDAARSTGA